MRDITERKRTELALQQAQRLDSIGVLAGGIAHDFNNLLTGVIAQASLAQMRLDRKSAAYVHIEKSLLSAEQAAELTQQLLAYVGKGSLTTETFNLNQLITRNTPILKTSIPVRTELHINLADYACPVLGDRKQIQQILLNLVINAGQAIKNRRGHIEIRTERTTVTSQYKLSTFVGSENIMPGDYIALIVKDNGEGMDRETASRIFEPFFSTKPVKEGMGGHGLGLSTALGVIRAHGGAIGVISQPGAGTEFTMLLPVSLEALSGGELNSAENDTAIMSEKAPVILVIDDESAVRTAINDILEMKNIHVLTANDGIQGVRQFTLNAAEIDGVILDMKMPNMGGEEAFDAMRRIDPRAKIIVSSGYSEKETMKRFIKEENVYYLEKPFDIAKLMDTIDRVLADGDQPVNGVA
jgi:nitrogen-specific signal transduction histidine kinase/ActR/RegA family two-component response regulator